MTDKEYKKAGEDLMIFTMLLKTIRWGVENKATNLNKRIETFNIYYENTDKTHPQRGKRGN